MRRLTDEQRDLLLMMTEDAEASNEDWVLAIKNAIADLDEVRTLDAFTEAFKKRGVPKLTATRSEAVEALAPDIEQLMSDLVEKHEAIPRRDLALGLVCLGVGMMESLGSSRDFIVGLVRRLPSTEVPSTGA